MQRQSTTKSENLSGIALMIAGMAAGAAVDAVIKSISAYAEPGRIVSVIGFGIAAIFMIEAKRRGQSMIVREFLHPAILLRTSCEVIGSFGTVIALGLVTLTTVTVLFQTVPLIVTLGAVLFMGERAALRDWVALLFGFFGVLLIIRPGFEEFDPHALIAVTAALALAARDLASRAVPKRVSTLQLGALGGMALGVSGLILSFVSSEPLPAMAPETIIRFTAIVLLAGITFYGITAAMRVGQVVVVSPFRYTRLLFGIFFGVIFFGEAIDLATVSGATLIVACGLYIWRREMTKVDEPEPQLG